MSFANHQLQHWLNELSAECGSELILNNEGRCVLEADNETSLALLADKGNQAYSINAHLLDLPESEREQVFSRALSLNLYQYETHGAAIALDELKNQLFLCFTASFDSTTYQQFKNTLNNFVDKAEQLKQALAPELSLDETSSKHEGDAGIAMLRI